MSSEYRSDEFIYFIEEPTGEFEQTGGKGGSKRNRPIKRKIVIEYDKIDSLDLERRGEQVPFTHKHVVNTPQYMLFYWSPLIGSEPCWLYNQLLSYCREDRDFLWDKLEELALRVRMSRPTLNKYLDVLEEHNFIIKVHRLNTKDNNRQTSPIIKVRQSVPLLSKELYEQLPDSIKKQHDKFMDRYGKNSSMEDSLYDSNETLNELLVSGQVKVTQKMKRKVDGLIREEKAIDYISIKLELSEQMKIKEFHEFLTSDKNYLSKPAYDTFMQDSFIFYNKEKSCVDLVVKDFTKKIFCENDIGKMYEDKFRLVAEKLYGIEGEEFEFYYYTFEEYVLKLERGI